MLSINNMNLVRQIACLKQFGCVIHFRITNEVASLVLWQLVGLVYLIRKTANNWQYTLIDGQPTSIKVPRKPVNHHRNVDYTLTETTGLAKCQKV